MADLAPQVALSEPSSLMSAVLAQLSAVPHGSVRPNQATRSNLPFASVAQRPPTGGIVDLGETTSGFGPFDYSR